VTLAAAATEERRIPLRASQLKSSLAAYLRSRDGAWLGRVSGNLGRTLNPTEPTPWSVETLATAMQETPEFMEKVIALLVAETPQLIAIEEGAQGTRIIVIPPSGLRWILRGGRDLGGEVV